MPSLARKTEFPAQRRHRLAVFQPDHKAHAFIHHRTFPPWHVLHLGSPSQNVSPMSPERSVTYVSGRSQKDLHCVAQSLPARNSVETSGSYATHSMTPSCV